MNVHVASPPTAEIHLEFLDGSTPEEYRAWVRHWDTWPDREVMAHPVFVSLFARPGDRVVGIAAQTPSGGGVLYPLIVRPFSREVWASPVQGGCDLTTAYAYGGPFAWNIGADEAAIFWRRFNRWAKGIGAATGFARLSLFPDLLLPFDGETLDRGPNVIRDLEPSEDAIWSHYESKVRQNVRRARREGVKIVSDFTGERLDDFLKVYESTMDRRGARDWYYFPRAMFERLITELPGRFVFTHAIAGDKVVSSDLTLLSERNAYYFLGGTLEEAFALRPNDLLKHETFLLCRSLGKRRLVLGGGYGTDDGLLKYKRAFAPGSEARFRIGVKTFDAAYVDRLVKRRADWERAMNHEWRPKEDFFPPYRTDEP